MPVAYRLDADAEQVEWDGSSDGYRLPTEAEWEHACRAAPPARLLDRSTRSRGTETTRTGDFTRLVVSNPTPGASTNDAEVYGAYRVLRGGGWFDEHWSSRASVRRRSHPTLQIDDLGSRVARSYTRRKG